MFLMLIKLFGKIDQILEVLFSMVRFVFALTKIAKIFFFEENKILITYLTAFPPYIENEK